MVMQSEDLKYVKETFQDLLINDRKMMATDGIKLSFILTMLATALSTFLSIYIFENNLETSKFLIVFVSIVVLFRLVDTLNIYQEMHFQSENDK